MGYPADKLKKEWIQKEITNETIEWARTFGEYLAKKEEQSRGQQGRREPQNPLSTSQLRRFFGEIRRIDADFKNRVVDLQMLRPMLAYAVGRDTNNTKIKPFCDEISEGITYTLEASKKEQAFKNLVKVFEAIVAYHKYYGGK